MMQLVISKMLIENSNDIWTFGDASGHDRGGVPSGAVGFGHPFVLQVVPCEGDESVGLLSRLELGTGFTLDCNEDLRTPGDPCVRVLR